MDTTQTVVLVLHTLIAILLIVLVLLQRGKGADAGAAFGAGASGTVFGARGSASFFSRATAVLATLFFVSSLGLAYLSSQQTEAPTSLLDTVEESDAGTADKTTSEAAGEGVPASEDADALPTLEDAPNDAENDTIEALPSVEEEPPSEEQ